MLQIKDIGLKDYQEVREYQKDLQQKLIAGDPDDYLIVCSHPPVITKGKSSKPNQVLATDLELVEKKILVLDIERGGETTYHDPGQLILYPILNLNRHKRDVSWYLRQLEEVIIQSLQDFGVRGVRIQGKTGVWVLGDNYSPDRKIASLGVRISRWCTLHGLAVNIFNSENFSVIIPCGLEGVQMTDLLKETCVDLKLSEELYTQFQEKIIFHFEQIFSSN